MLADFKPSVNAEYRVRIENPDGEVLIVVLKDASIGLESKVGVDKRPTLTLMGIIDTTSHDRVVEGARGT